MPIISNEGALSFVDIAARKFGEKQTREQTFVNLAKTRNDIWEDLLMRPASNGDTEVVRFRTALPEAEWLHIGKGLTSSKGSVASTRIVCGNVGSKLEVLDKIKRKAEASGTWESMYREETAGHTETIALEVVKALLYGDLRDNPDGFNGLCKWYAKHTSNDDTIPAFNVIDGGATDDKWLGSIYLVGWGDNGIYGFYPNDSKTAGIEISPLEKTRIVESAARPQATLWAWIQEYELNVGLAVADWRKGGRICNIDRFAHLGTFASEDARKAAARAFFSKINTLCSRVDESGTTQKLYMDQFVWEQAKEFAMALTVENAVKEEDLNGKKIRALNGIPVRINKVQQVDELLVSQA